MIRFKGVYGAGFRAGKMPKPIITKPDGTKVLGKSESPFKLRRQFILRWIWETGYYDGMMKSLSQPIRGNV